MKIKKRMDAQAGDEMNEHEILPAESDAALRAQAPLEIQGGTEIGRLIARGMSENMAPEAMRELFALYREMDDRMAFKSFNAALADFQAECPSIPRRHTNDQFKVNRAGVMVGRPYADLNDIKTTIRPILAKHGLSLRFGDATVDADGMMTKTCIVAHRDGHSVSNSLTMPIGSKSGASDIQKFGIASTYLERYTLTAALGITSCDDDTDGNDPTPAETVTDGQAKDLADMLSNIAPARHVKFLAMFGATTVGGIPARDYDRAVAMLQKAISDTKE